MTVLGGGRRKIVTTDRSGRTVDRYEVRWRAHVRPGGQREYRQRFDRAGDADEFIRRLKAVGLAGSTWMLDDEGRPVDRTTLTAGAATTREMTMWSGLLLYRAATWRGASGNGRRAAATVLRAMAKTLRAGAPKVPSATLAYLDTIAFRCENEPDGLALVETQKVVHVGRVFCADDIDAGRAFLERWSLPLADLERSHIRALIAELGSGRAPATEGRRWTQMRAILRWWADEDLVANNLTSRLNNGGSQGATVVWRQRFGWASR